jgi:hypothetical protein
MNMILVNSYEEALFDLFRRALALYVSGPESWLNDYSTNQLNRFKNSLQVILISYLTEIIKKHYEIPFQSRNKREILLSLAEDGSIEPVTKTLWLADKKEIARLVHELYNNFANCSEMRTLRRILSVEVCIQQLEEKIPAMQPRKDLLGESETPEYLTRCFVDDSLPTINEKNINISEPLFCCFNQVKQKVETLGKDDLRDLLRSFIVGEKQQFKIEFINRIVKESYKDTKLRPLYDYIIELSCNFLDALHNVIYTKELFVDYAEDILLKRMLGNSMFFEVYVFRKLSDVGIPCMFHLEMRDREFDLLYWGDIGPGVIEVKTGTIDADKLRESQDILRNNGINKFVVVCSEGELLRIDRVGAELLTFDDLNDLTKLASLVNIKDL